MQKKHNYQRTFMEETGKDFDFEGIQKMLRFQLNQFGWVHEKIRQMTI